MRGAWLICKAWSVLPGVKDDGHTRPSFSADGVDYCTICGVRLPPKP